MSSRAASAASSAPVVRGVTSLEFTFLGTASATPTARRNVTSAALRADSEIMVFDCGEATQHQVMRCSAFRTGRIRRVFVTHTHGDHMFGLPGLVTALCAVRKEQSRASEQSTAPEDRLRVYGPRGIRQYLKTAMNVSRVRIPREFHVHELVRTAEEGHELSRARGVALHDHRKEPFSDTVVLPQHSAEGTSWHLFDNGAYAVSAGFLQHTVHCWGYVFTEYDQVGKMDMMRLMQTPLANKPLGPWLSRLKAGETIDGVTREDVCGPTLPGRKVAIMGDTCDASGVAHLAKDCSLLVHEATMLDYRIIDARKRGHSTPSMTAAFAKRIGAKELAVTHFGGELCNSSNGAAMAELCNVVKSVYGKAPILAKDFLTLTIERDKIVKRDTWDDNEHFVEGNPLLGDPEEESLDNTNPSMAEDKS